MKDKKMAARPYRAVLTGASGGIGNALAGELAKTCEWLILVGRNPEAMAALRAQIGSGTCDVHIVQGDLTQDATLQRVTVLARELGGLNLLINNAGTSDFHAFETQSIERIQNLLLTNLLAPMLLVRHLLPLLRLAPAAQIINVGSVFGHIGFPGYAAYCASKAGLRGFTQSLRRELSDTRIQVRHFAPRATRTAINSAGANAMNRELKTAEDTPEQVARALMRFLEGDRWEKTLGLQESFFVLLNKLLPAFPDKAIGKQLPIIRKHLPK